MNIFGHVQHGVCSETGTVRGNNEDAFLALPADGVYAVADGMGGGSDGEIASNTLLSKLQETLTESSEDAPGLRKYNAQQAILQANEAIFAYAQEHHYAQMGTTLVLFVQDSWTPGLARLCHVGDSRAYRLRGGELTQLTADHNLENLLSDCKNPFGQSAPANGGKFKRLLTRAVGVSSQVVPEWQELELQPNDRYLLCTDGVTTMLTDGEIWDILRQAESPASCVARFRQEIMDAGAQDNFTLICLQIAEHFPEPYLPDESEKNENEYLLKTSEWRNDHA